MKKVIIIGATSGIGMELAKLYAQAGALVGAIGSRPDFLNSLRLEYTDHIVTVCFDATYQESIAHLDQLIT